ncbi:MAG TPA: DUF938 domain-containing protein [Burkholderiales bacterium]|nr:DUF938 domain-containing protein [Burkholderiales bacterium]
MTSVPAPKPYSEACERNREPILGVLEEFFAESGNALEIGSGTGQHAIYFAAALPHLVWHTSDRLQNHPGINAWIDEAGLANIRRPLALDVDDDHWPVRDVDAVFSANTLHIMSWHSVENMFRGIGRVLPPGGMLVIYGPFSYGGRHTAASNARFDAQLRARDPASGIRDFEAVAGLAEAQGLRLVADRAMPANNRSLVWRRAAPVVALQ